jgi:hypothetical protein
MKMAGWRWWADRASPVPFPWPANIHRILTLSLSKGEAPDGRLLRSPFDKLRMRAFIRAAAHPSGGLQIEQLYTAVQRQAAAVERGGELPASVAGNQNGRVVSSVMADVAGSMGWTWLAQQPNPTQYQLIRLHPPAYQTGPREQEPDSQVHAGLQCLAMRPLSLRMLAMSAKAVALWMDSSRSFARRRQRPSHANVRSTTGGEAGRRSPWPCLSA